MRQMKIKLVTALPSSGRFVPFQWAMSLPGLVTPMNIGYAQLASLNSNRGEGRELLVDKAREMGAEYIFFLDDDTVVPSDTLLRLLQELESDPEAMVCGGIYTSKTTPPQPLVFKDLDDGVYWNWKHGEVFPCFCVGTGCMMIRLSVFDRLEKPWFKDITWHESQGAPTDEMVPENAGAYTMTDDVYFCSKLADIGAKVLAHGGVLPVHYGQNGQPHVMERTAPPLRGVAEPLWYERANLVAR